MYRYDQRPNTQLTEASQAALQAIRASEYSVLVGRNNSGKSYLLKSLASQWGLSSSYLGPARYQNFNLLGYYTPNQNRRNDRWQQFIQMWHQQQQNIDNSPVNLQQAIAELTDAQRGQLVEIVELLLGVKLEIRLTAEENSMSQKYISVGGHNISYTSSGFRLITTLVTSLLDSDYDTFLVDEPELGISPEAQGILADFLFDRVHRERYFPHIKTLVLATHSTVFLDRRVLTNNYTVGKRGNEIELTRVQTQAELNQVHFFLLGNRFETLYLPSAIVLVEGKTDHKFIERVLALRYPEVQFSVVAAHSDSRIQEVLAVARGLLSDLQRSPYHDRIFVVLDSVHQAGLPALLSRMGVRPENIVTWSKNGVEYVYPPQIVDRVYGAGDELSVAGDRVSRNGISYTKAELLEKVLSGLEARTPMHPEFESAFLAKIAARVG
jgi:hypothetical protein